MKFKKIMAMALSCAMIASFAAGCGGGNDAPATTDGGASANTGDTIKVGGLAPLTGEVSIYGIACNNGIKLAIDEVNAAGGVLGKQIEYIVYDEKGDETEAVNAYNKLVQNDKVVAILGDVTSKPCIAVAIQAAKEGIPMITGTGTAVDITPYGSNIFRACFTDPFQGEVMASYAFNKLGAKTAAIIADNGSDYSVGLTETFVSTAESLGMEIVANEAYATGDKDFKAQLTNIASKNPDVLFVPNYYEDVALIAAQAKEVGLTATMLGADGWAGTIAQLAGDTSTVNGAYFCNHYSPDGDDPDLVNFISAYKAKFNEDPNAFAALGYDAAKMMFAAMEAAGSTDYAAVSSAMQALSYKGATGSITFDAERNPIKSAAILTIEDGAYKFVETYNK